MFGKTKSSTQKGGSKQGSLDKKSSGKPATKKSLYKIHNISTLFIASKPFTGLGGIPRSFLQQQQQDDPTGSTSPSTNPTQKKKNPNFSFGSHSQSTATSTQTNHPSDIIDPSNPPPRQRTRGEKTLSTISQEQRQDTHDFAQLFSPDNLEKYPFLELVYEQVRQGDFNGASDTLHSMTRTIQQDVGEDPALTPIFDPTKHQTFTQALGEFIYHEGHKELPKPVHFMPKIRIKQAVEETDQPQVLSKTPQHHKITSKDDPTRKPIYKSSPPAKQVSSSVWQQLIKSHSHQFENFNNPSFLSSLDPKKGRKEKTLDQLDIENNNPWYLPDGTLNIQYFRENAENFGEADSKYIKDGDIEGVIHLLNNLDEPTPRQLRNKPFDEIEQRSLEEGHLHPSKRTPKSTVRSSDPNEDRARVAFGGKNELGVPSTSQLTSVIPQKVAKYKIDQSRLNNQLGEPLLDELNTIMKLSDQSKEIISVDPMRGSLTTLTPTDVERIKKEYSFTDPQDLIAYIKRFLGRAAVEVDHRYNLPRAEYELLEEQYRVKIQQNQDLNAMKALMDHDRGSDVEDEKRHDSVFDNMPTGLNSQQRLEWMRNQVAGSIRRSDHVAGENFMDRTSYLEKIPGRYDDKGQVILPADAKAPVDPTNPDQSQQALLQNILFNTGQMKQPQDEAAHFNSWQNKSSSNVQNAVGLSGVFGNNLADTIYQREHLHNARQEQEVDESPSKTAAQLENDPTAPQKLALQHRHEFINSLNVEENARLRTFQIALKAGKEYDEDFIESRYASLMQLFKHHENKAKAVGDDEASSTTTLELLLLSPEDRAQKIIKKTEDKLQQLYTKYLPEQTPEEKEAILDEKIRELEHRGDKAKLEHELQQKHSYSMLKETQDVRDSTKIALQQRQDALIRRQREIEMYERSLSWTQQGKNRGEIDILERLHQLDQREKGFDVNPLTAQMDTSHVNSNEFSFVHELLGTKSVEQQVQEQKEAILGSSTAAITGGAGETETKPLLGSVKRRHLMKELKMKQITGTLPQLDSNGVIQIDHASFAKQAEIEKQRRLETQQRAAQEKLTQVHENMKQLESNEFNQLSHSMLTHRQREDELLLSLLNDPVTQNVEPPNVDHLTRDVPPFASQEVPGELFGLPSLKKIGLAQTVLKPNESPITKLGKIIQDKKAKKLQPDDLISDPTQQLADHQNTNETRMKKLIANQSAPHSDPEDPMKKSPQYKKFVKEFDKLHIELSDDSTVSDAQGNSISKTTSPTHPSPVFTLQDEENLKQLLGEDYIPAPPIAIKKGQLLADLTQIASRQPLSRESARESRLRDKELKRQQKQQQYIDQILPEINLAKASNAAAAVSNFSTTLEDSALHLQKRAQKADKKKVALPPPPIDATLSTQSTITVDKKVTGSAVHHASALDAFLADNDDFDNLFAAQAVDEQSPQQLQLDADAAFHHQQREINTKENDFVELEGKVVTKSLLEKKQDEALKEFEDIQNELKPLLRMTKSSTTLLSQLQDAKEGKFPAQPTPVRIVEASLENQIENQVPLETLANRTQSSLFQIKQQNKSIFGKLQTHREELQALTELQQQGELDSPIDPTAPFVKKTKFKLSQDLLKVPQHENQIDPTVSSELISFVHSFREQLGLPHDPSIEKRDLTQIKLLDEVLADEFQESLILAQEHSLQDYKREAQKAKRLGHPPPPRPVMTPVEGSMNKLKQEDPQGFLFMLSLVYESGGDMVHRVSKAMSSAEEAAMAGKITSIAQFRLALKEQGLSDEIIREMHPDITRLFNDIEAQRLGLDQGGDLVDDEGTPLIIDPLADQITNAQRPIYSEQVSDLTLLAAMKRKERSTIFKDLDAQVDDEIEKEVMAGSGLFQALSQPSLRNTSIQNHFSLPQNSVDKLEDSNRYKSLRPNHENPENVRAGVFEDFFTMEEKMKAESKFADQNALSNIRQNVFQGLLKAIDTDSSFSQKEPSLLRFNELTARNPDFSLSPFPDRVTHVEMNQISVGIQNRIEVLVDRISRHTLITPAAVLKKLENPSEFAKLIGLLTPEMVREMHLVDNLLNDDAAPRDKQMFLEMADIETPYDLTNKQVLELLPTANMELEGIYEEQHLRRPADIGFKEDQNRDYLKGFVHQTLLTGSARVDGKFTEKTVKKLFPSVETTNKLIADGKLSLSDMINQVGEEIEQAVDTNKRRISAQNKLQDILRGELDASPALIDEIRQHDEKQTSLLESINKKMEKRDKLLQNQLLISVRDGVKGENSRKFIVDTVLSKPTPFSARRKLQLLRLKNDEAEEMLKTQEVIFNRLLASVDTLDEQLHLGQAPKFISDSQNVDDDIAHLEAVEKSLALIQDPSALAGPKISNIITPYDISFAKKQLEDFAENPTQSPLAQLIDFWNDEKTSALQIEQLKNSLSTTTFGRLYRFFGHLLPTLPKKTPSSVALSKFFDQPDSKHKINDFMGQMDKGFQDQRDNEHSEGDNQAFGNELGRLVRSALEETAIAQLPAATQEKISKSRLELERVFKEYRQVEIMLDRQMRLTMIERDRERLGLPDFKQLNMLKLKFDLILSTLQSPGLHHDKKQELMTNAREIMTQTIAVRNLKENDPEVFYWRSFLAKLPPRFHKHAMGSHNMPLDPNRLFTDLNPNEELSRQEVLENICRFIMENYKDTQRLYQHVEQRGTNNHTGHQQMTLRDLRKEQLVCRRLITMKNHLTTFKSDAKEILRKEHTDEYIHQLRILRMKRLMDEPDLNEVKRQQLEFWLDESHQKGKGAGLQNVLLQDLHDNLDTPIGAINGSMVAHKKLLRRKKAQVDPTLFNAKTSRLFSNDRLNPMIKYEKVLKQRNERRKTSIRRLAAEEDISPVELAAINAAREGNRLLTYLGQHGVGSNNTSQDIHDLLLHQQRLLLEQQEVLQMEDVVNMNQIDDLNPDSPSINKPKHQDALTITAHKPKDEIVSLEKRTQRKQVIETQLATVSKQLSNLITKKEDFDSQLHVRHDSKDVSLVHVANQPFVYGRVVAAYGQTVVIEQCGSNSYMKHAQFFVQDELEQIQRAAGYEGTQLDNQDNLDGEEHDDGNVDEHGNLIDSSSGTLALPKEDRKRNAIRGNRRRWHCIKSRHMDLLCGDYVFIDPAPGRAWSSGANESTAHSTLAAMNNTGSPDHGVVKATFSRLNQLARSSRSSSKLQHLEEANPIAANCDHLVILCAAEGQPQFSTSLVDRYLAAASFAGIKATIVYNKIDLIEMVNEAEKILSSLKQSRSTLHEKEKTLRKKLGKKDFRRLKRNLLKDQKKRLKDTHFYTSTMQRYYNKLLYSESLAKELQLMDEEEQLDELQTEQQQQNNLTQSDLYEEDQHGRLVKRETLSLSKLPSTLHDHKPNKYSVPALVPRDGDKRAHAIDYYYNDEEFDDEEEDRVLLEQQLERWITKKQRQHSREIEEKLREYERLGIKVIRCSSHTGVGVEELNKLLSRFHSTGFVGQSGVGKTSLLNSLIPDLELQTNNITVEGKGQHTTTSSRMFHLPFGGSVIDTPGSQSFVPPAVDPDYVQELFPEIKALAKFCKLGPKCCHTKEVGCAVREAVGDGSNRALIPVTITELFDPELITNMRVQEFRSRLESGELRDLVKNAGNDPVLLYAQRFYQDLDDGKITNPNVHAHIPLDTAMDLGVQVEMDASGQVMLQAKENARRANPKNPLDFEKYPANVIPLELSDIESDGFELPYHIRKLKHTNRELDSLITLKLQRFGDDAQFTDEEVEIAVNEKKIDRELTLYRNRRQHLKAHGILGDENDPKIVQQREAKARKKAKLDAQLLKETEFNLNFSYDIEAMTQQVLKIQGSDELLQAPHIDELHGDPDQFKVQIIDDARNTAIALAEIDLQDKLANHTKRQQERVERLEKEQEQAVLQFRADKLGISVPMLLKLQSMVKQQQQNSEDDDDSFDFSDDDADKELNPTSAAHVDQHAFPEEPIDVQLEKPLPVYAQRPMKSADDTAPLTSLSRREQYKKMREDKQHGRVEAGKLVHEFSLGPSVVAYRGFESEIEDGNAPTELLEDAANLIYDKLEAERQQLILDQAAAQPAWKKERDALTKRRFASRLPADSNAFIPQFRYDSYIQIYDLMKKTKEFLQKRKKKKSLTRQEEDKIQRRTKQAEQYEERQLARRRVIIDSDPYGLRSDLIDRSTGKQTKLLDPEQQAWLDTKILNQHGVELPGKLSLVTDSQTTPIRKKKTALQLEKDQIMSLLKPSALKSDPENNDDDVRGFQHQMLSAMSNIYDERKKITDDKSLSHSEHWRRTGHLKSTWNELQELEKRNSLAENLGQDEMLGKTRFGGHKNTFMQSTVGNSFQNYSDDESNSTRKMQQGITTGYEDKLDKMLSATQKDKSPPEHNSIDYLGQWRH